MKSAIAYMPEVIFVKPYKGAKDMLLVSDVDNKYFLTELFNAMYEDLPTQKKIKITKQKQGDKKILQYLVWLKKLM